MIKKIFRISAKAEEYLLCLMLTSMILLACTQIVLRTFFSTGLIWIDPLLRYLVLWSGFIGASMATYKGKHIALDVISYLVPEPIKTWLETLTSIFSMIVAALLTYASFLFIRDEYTYGGPGLFELPMWFWSAIFPLAFTLITIRFAMLAVNSFISLLPKSVTTAKGNK